MRTVEGDTLLHCAFRKEEYDTVKKLYLYGAKFYITNDKGIRSQNLKENSIVKFIFHLFAHENLDTIHDIFSKIQFDIDKLTSYKKQNLLHLLSEDFTKINDDKFIEIINFLKAEKIILDSNLTARDANNNTPLDLAFQAHNKDRVSQLLQMGAIFEVKDKNGNNCSLFNDLNLETLSIDTSYGLLFEGINQAKKNHDHVLLNSLMRMCMGVNLDTKKIFNKEKFLNTTIKYLETTQDNIARSMLYILYVNNMQDIFLDKNLSFPGNFLKNLVANAIMFGNTNILESKMNFLDTCDKNCIQELTQAAIKIYQPECFNLLKKYLNQGKFTLDNDHYVIFKLLLDMKVIKPKNIDNFLNRCRWENEIEQHNALLEIGYPYYHFFYDNDWKIVINNVIRAEPKLFFEAHPYYKLSLIQLAFAHGLNEKINYITFIALPFPENAIKESILDDIMIFSIKFDNREVASFLLNIIRANTKFQSILDRFFNYIVASNVIHISTRMLRLLIDNGYENGQHYSGHSKISKLSSSTRLLAIENGFIKESDAYAAWPAVALYYQHLFYRYELLNNEAISVEKYANDLHHQDTLGRTILHLALLKGKIMLAENILLVNPNLIDIKDNQGCSPRDLIENNKNIKLHHLRGFYPGCRNYRFKLDEKKCDVSIKIRSTPFSFLSSILTVRAPRLLDLSEQPETAQRDPKTPRK